MGLTNSVQPYCRFAIITMQMMPKISCPQRVHSVACARSGVVVGAVTVPVVDIFSALLRCPTPLSFIGHCTRSNGRSPPPVVSNGSRNWEQIQSGSKVQMRMIKISGRDLVPHHLVLRRNMHACHF